MLAYIFLFLYRYRYLLFSISKSNFLANQHRVKILFQRRHDVIQFIATACRINYYTSDDLLDMIAFRVFRSFFLLRAPTQGKKKILAHLSLHIYIAFPNKKILKNNKNITILISTITFSYSKWENIILYNFYRIKVWPKRLCTFMASFSSSLSNFIFKTLIQNFCVFRIVHCPFRYVNALCNSIPPSAM